MVEGLLTTGPTPSSFFTSLKQQNSIFQQLLQIVSSSFFGHLATYLRICKVSACIPPGLSSVLTLDICLHSACLWCLPALWPTDNRLETGLSLLGPGVGRRGYKKMDHQFPQIMLLFDVVLVWPRILVSSSPPAVHLSLRDSVTSRLSSCAR